MKLKDIDGLLIEKKDVNAMVRMFGISTDSYLGQGFNEAIYQQGEKEITLDREKLVKIIDNAHIKDGYCANGDFIANEIISNLPSIIKVKQ